jgi:hypothetical protein
MTCGICGGQTGDEAGFLPVIRFPCQFLIHRLSHANLSPGAGTIGPPVAGVPSGLSLTLPHEGKKSMVREEASQTLVEKASDSEWAARMRPIC